MDYPTLSDLIIEVQARRRWSYRDLAARSPAGSGLNKERWGEFRRGTAKTFNAAQVHGIASALGVPAPAVGRAVLAQMGISAAPDVSMEEAIRGDGGLSVRDKRVLLAALMEIRKVGYDRP